MPAKQILFDMKACEAIQRGVSQLAKVVSVTLGPCGKNVLIERSFGGPTVTKDGVTVAKEIELSDPNENLGAQMVKEVASKTSDVAGDGTTTATIYAEAIFIEGLKNVAAGANEMELKRGIDLGVTAIVKHLQSMSIDVDKTEQIAQVGMCAANQDEEIGKHIAHAMDKVGKDGVITVEEGKSLDTTVELVEGMQFDKGYISPHFINNENMTVELEKPLILLSEKKISSANDIVKVMETAVTAKRSLLIIAEDIDGEALAVLVVNKLRGILNSAAVKAPGFGDRRKAMLEDLAILTGGEVISEDIGLSLEKMELKQLGQAKKVTIDKDNTTIIEGGGGTPAIKGRIDQIKTQVAATTSDYDVEKLEERLAKLSGGVAQINVGAATEIEMKEKKARVEDALHACRAAVEEGILPGGAVAVLSCFPALDAAYKKAKGDQKTGVDIVRRALTAPIKQIAANAGLDGSIVAMKVQEAEDPNYGYNALTCEYGDMIKMGVLVPTKVERVALINAASVAGLLLTTDAIVTEIKEESKGGGGPPDMSGMGGMGGMM